MKKIFVLLCMVSFVTSAYCIKEPPKKQVTFHNYLFLKESEGFLESYNKKYIHNQNIDILDFTNTNVTNKQLSDILKMVSSTKKLVLKGCNKLTEDSFKHITTVAQRKGIKSLDISNITLIEDVEIMMEVDWLVNLYKTEAIKEFIFSKPNKFQLQTLNKNVTSLDLGEGASNIYDETYRFRKLKKFKSKTFYLTKMQTTPLIGYIPHLSQVTHLDFSDCNEKIDFTKLDASNRPLNLTHLNLENTPVDDKAIDLIKKLPDLKSLNLYNTSVSVKFLEELAESDLTKSLEELSYSPKHTNRDDANRIFAAFGKFKKLKKIKIPGLYKGSANFVHLKHLPLEEATFLEVDITPGAGYNWDSLNLLPKTIHTLTFEAAKEGKGLFSYYIKSLFRSQAKPEARAKLTNLSKLTVKGIKSFNNKKLPHLLKTVSQLHISDCGRIDFSGEHAPNLQSLTLNHYKSLFESDEDPSKTYKRHEGINVTFLIENQKNKYEPTSPSEEKNFIMVTMQTRYYNWKAVRKVVLDDVHRWATTPAHYFSKPPSLIFQIRVRAQALAKKNTAPTITIKSIQY